VTSATTPSRTWHVLGAPLAGLLAYLTLASGVALAGYLGALQIGVLVGIVVGLTSPSWRLAAGAAAAALVVGAVVSPPWFDSGQPLTLVVMALAGIALAAGARAAVDSGQLRAQVVVGFALLVLVGSVWLVASSIVSVPTARDQGRTPLQELARRPVAGEQWSDSEFYRAVVWRMRDGEPFLSAFRAAYHDNGRWKSDPNSMLGVRTPVIFEFWSLLPGQWAVTAFWTLLGLTSIAMLASPLLISRAVSPVLSVAGAAGLASYVLGFALSPTLLFLSEIWTGVIAVLVFALLALAMRPGAARGWTLAAVALAFVAAISRELMVFLMVAGLIAALFAPKGRRGFDLAAWGTAFVAFFALWAAHLSQARHIVTAIKSVGFAWTAHGGVGNLLSGLTSSTWSVGTSWVPIMLAVLGILGALAQPDRQFRAFATAAVVMPLIGFLFVGTDAVLRGSGIAFNYWGAIVVPVLFVLAPASLAWIPGMRPAPDNTSLSNGSTTEAAA
jgi:hypothetical protein